MLQQGRFGVELRTLSAGAVHLVQPGRYQIIAVLLDQSRQCFRVELAPGNTEPGGKFLSKRILSNAFIHADWCQRYGITGWESSQPW